MPSPFEGGVPQYLNYEYGAKRVLTARPNSGYEFVKWDDGLTTPSREITVTGEKTYTVYFRVNRVLGNESKAVKLKLNLDEVKGLLLNFTKIYEKNN